MAGSESFTVRSAQKLDSSLCRLGERRGRWIVSTELKGDLWFAG